MAYKKVKKINIKIYRKDKLLKMYSTVSKNGETLLFLYTFPKNFRKNIDEAEQKVAKRKTKKTKYASLIFFLINLVVIGVILGIQIGQQGDMSFTTLLNSTFSPGILFFILLVFLFNVFVEAIRTNILIKQSTGRSRPFLSVKTNLLGHYYDCITPMSTGGQPFQIYYMVKRGLNPASAISVPMGKYVISQITVSFLWTICLIAGFCVDLGSNFDYIKPLCVVGWFLNILIMVAVTLLSVNQRIGKKLVIWGVKFLHKIKIVKDYEKTYNSVINTVTDFQVTVKNFAKNFFSFCFLIFTNLVNLFINYSMAFLVYSCMIGYFDFSMFWIIFLLNAMIDIAASFIPLPGGTGVSELSFAALFAFIFAGNGVMLTWALLIWRFMTYYINLIVGIFVIAYDNFWGNQKYLWLKKKWELESESMTFTQDKLHEYSVQKKKNPKKLV